MHDSPLHGLAAEYPTGGLGLVPSPMPAAAAKREIPYHVLRSLFGALSCAYSSRIVPPQDFDS